MNKINFLNIILLIPVLLKAGYDDSTSYIEIHTSYGTGNYIPGFYDADAPAKRDFSELLIKFDINFQKQIGVDFTFDGIQSLEEGFGCNECSNPQHYSLDLKGNFLSAFLYLNGKYFGFKYGIVRLRRDRGFSEEDPNLKETYPTFEFKIGLLNKAYLTVATPMDFINFPLTVYIKYHFRDYFSQIWIGKIIKEPHYPDIYLLKIQRLIYTNYIISVQGHISPTDNLKGVRVGLSYLIQWPG